jgi:general secretion pathway protein E
MTTRSYPLGRLDWRFLLQWLQDDGLVTAADAERVRARFGAGDSSQHPLLRLGGAELVDARAGWPATLACPTCASIH